MSKTIKRAGSTILALIMVISVVGFSSNTIFRIEANAYDISFEDTAYWPVPSSRKINQRFYYNSDSNNHKGLDIGGSIGVPVIASKSGKVVAAQPKWCNHTSQGASHNCVGTDLGTYGNYVEIKNNDGTTSRYGHMQYNTICVSVGQQVSAGQQIGCLGSSGSSTGPHLHFEIYKGSYTTRYDQVINPSQATVSRLGLTGDIVNSAREYYLYNSRHTLTVNYYSNYADKSFDNPLNAVGSNKNVIVRTSVFYSDQNVPDGFHNYTKTSNVTYLGRTGYTGTGYWNTKADGSGYSVDQNTAFSNGKLMAQAVGKDISSADATVNLYAQWTPNKLTVNYYSNYADKSFDNPKNAVSASSNVLVRTSQFDYSTVVQYGLVDYSHEGDSTYLGRTGYMPTGYWNTKADGSGYRIYEDERNITGNQIAQRLGLSIANGNASVNLYPEWIMPTYTFDHDPNGGTISVNPTVSVKFGEEFSTRNTTCTRTGYTFSGWYARRNSDNTWAVAGKGWFSESEIREKGYQKQVFSNNRTLKLDYSWTDGLQTDLSFSFVAQWTPNTYTVIFSGNGATSGSMSPQTFTYDVAQNLTANAFQRKYTVTYNYNGATGGNSTTTATANAVFLYWLEGMGFYVDQEKVKNLATSGTYNLCAAWRLGTVTLPTPTRTNYIFDGWYTDSSLTSYAGAGGASYEPTKNITLYAKWSTAPATLTGVAVKAYPTKMTYTVGETLNTAGLTLTATYSDGSTKTITSGFTCSPTKLNTAGQQTITVTYGGKTTSFAVTVNNAAPTQGRVRAVSINDVSINYKASATIKLQITADDGVKYTVSYSSSDPNIVKVNEKTGEVTGVKRGTATVTCTVTDEYGNTVSDTCKVTVNYTAWQWVIIILLFGWIWYI